MLYSFVFHSEDHSEQYYCFMIKYNLAKMEQQFIFFARIFFRSNRLGIRPFFDRIWIRPKIQVCNPNPTRSESATLVWMSNFRKTSTKNADLIFGKCCSVDSLAMFGPIADSLNGRNLKPCLSPIQKTSKRTGRLFTLQTILIADMRYLVYTAEIILCRHYSLQTQDTYSVYSRNYTVQTLIIADVTRVSWESPDSADNTQK